MLISGFRHPMRPREMRRPGGMGARGFFFRINMQNDACNLFPDRAIILGIKQTQISDQMLFIIRSEEHTSELQSLMRISYAVFCLKKKKQKLHTNINIDYMNSHIKITIFEMT